MRAGSVDDVVFVGAVDVDMEMWIWDKSRGPGTCA